MLTAYDYPSALACSSSHLTDITLVGDSLAQVCLGYTSTTQLTVGEMIHHTRAVARGTTHPFLIADMPFGSYHTIDNAVSNAIKLVQEGRAEAVKIEGGQEFVSVVKRLSEIGIPVMAHVGLLPQRHSAMSGYKVQGRSAEGAKKVVADALALEEAGAFAMVVEAVPRELGKYVTDRLRIPTIGIGAGPWTSGQVRPDLIPFKKKFTISPKVLVYDDVMGTWAGHKAKFVRRFANLKELRDTGVHSYAEAVKARTFPDPETESYAADQAQWERFMENERDDDDVQ